MQPTLKSLTMRPGTVSPVFIFGCDVKTSDGRVLAAFACHGQAFRALPVAGGSSAYGDWVASMSPEDLKKAGRLNSYLASQPEYKA